MSEYNSIEVPIVPDSPKTIPNEVLHVYVPKAGYNAYGAAKFNKEDFLITEDGTVKLRTDLKIPIYTTNKLPEEYPLVYGVFDSDGTFEYKLAFYSHGARLGGFIKDGNFVVQGNITSKVGFQISNDADGTNISLGFEDFNKVKNLDTKYMKKPDASMYSIVPYINTSGDQGTYFVSSVAMGGAIPMYGPGGVLRAIDPILDEDCVNKKYVEDEFLVIPKSDGTIVKNAIPCIDNNGNQTFKRFSNSVYTGYIPTRDGNGCLKTGPATDEEHCTNKKYVDDAVSSLGWTLEYEYYQVSASFELWVDENKAILLHIYGQSDAVTALIAPRIGSGIIYSTPFMLMDKLAYIRYYNGSWTFSFVDGSDPHEVLSGVSISIYTL